MRPPPTPTNNTNTTTTTTNNATANTTTTTTTIGTNATVFNGTSITNAAGTTTINATANNATALLDDSDVTKDNATDNGTAAADIAGNDPRINSGGINASNTTGATNITNVTTSTSTSTSTTSLAPELIVVMATTRSRAATAAAVQRYRKSSGFDHPGRFLATCYCYNGTAFVAPGRASIALGGTGPVDCADGTERMCEARLDVIHSTMMAVAVIAGCCAVGAVLCSQRFCCRRRCARAMG